MREVILEKCKCFYVLHLYCREGEAVVKGFETFWKLLAKVEILVKFSRFPGKKCQLVTMSDKTNSYKKFSL